MSGTISHQEKCNAETDSKCAKTGQMAIKIEELQLLEHEKL